MTTEYTKNFGLAKPDFRMGPWHDLVNGDLDKIDQIVFGALSSVDTPPWENGTHYIVGATAIDQESAQTWLCLVEHTSAASGTFNADRTAHPTYWTQLLSGFAPRGEWQHNTNYFPYDLAYQTVGGILGLCTTRHVSNAAGNMKTDAAYWSFLVDFSTINLSTASLVSYVPASGLTGTNVQTAIDQVEAQVHSLDSVNTTQGSQITGLQTNVGALNSRVTAVETSNSAQSGDIATLQSSVASQGGQITTLDAAALKKAGNQDTTGGFRFAAFNAGTKSSGTFTPDAYNHNYQYYTNGGAHTLAAPTNDCAIDILVTNSATAGVIAFSGFTVGATGDVMTTTSGYKFIISIRRINGTATYVIKALQP